MPCVTQIYVHPGLAIPFRRHRGSAMESCVLRAVPQFGPRKREAFDFVAIRCAPLSPVALCSVVISEMWLRATLQNVPCHICWLPCRAQEGDDPMEGCWFAQLRMIFSMRDHKGRMRECAFLRWMETAPDDAFDDIPMQRLTWATTFIQDSRKPVPHYDVVEINRIVRPVFLQRQPDDPDHFFYNEFV